MRNRVILADIRMVGRDQVIKYFVARIRILRPRMTGTHKRI